jgi:hypothetical protein
MQLKDVIGINLYMIMHLDLLTQINKSMFNVVMKLLMNFHQKVEMEQFLCMGKLPPEKLSLC